MSDEAISASVEAIDARESRRRSHRVLAVELASSYAVAAARVGSNAVVVGLLYRNTTATWVAAFVLMRSLLGVTNYMMAGLGPATLRELTRVSAPFAARIETVDRVVTQTQSTVPPILEYALPNAAREVASPPSRRANALIVSLVFMFGAGAIALLFFACVGGLRGIGTPSGFSSTFGNAVLAYAIGLLFRAGSEPAGAVMQRFGRLAIDNSIVAAGEAAFALSAYGSVSTNHSETFALVCDGFLVTGMVVWLVRWLVAAMVGDTQSPTATYDAKISRRIGWTALAVSVGSFADFLYAPANVFIINRTLDPTLLAAYGPALQIDAALLLTIAAVAPVLLPRVANAIAERDLASARRMYVIAMIAGTAVLLAAAAVVLIARGPLLRVWLGQVPAMTLAILPLVLVHTVVGGTAGIGRAVLLGMGRFRAYTVSALVGGVANVLLALLFVLGFGWGLRGIVCATIVAVVGRCAVWMPWYILRALREGSAAGDPAAQRPA